MENETYDLAVIGAGTAGLPCAIEAAGAGARVLVVEKAGCIGGTLHISGGHLSAAGTRRQVAHGIADSADDHFDDVIRISRGTANEALVRRAVDLAASTVDWLEENGFEFATDCPRIVYGHEPYRVARTYYGVDEARSILAVLAPLFERAVNQGSVDLRLDSKATRLLVERGAVVGLAYERDGREEVAHARSTVLTSGGFAASTELFEALHRRPLVSAARETSTGDAIGLVRPLDGSVVGGDLYLPTFGGLPSPEGPALAQWHDRPLLVAAERPPWEIYVGRDGRRFVAEDDLSVHRKEEALSSLHDLTFFTVFDDRAVSESEDIVVGWSSEDVRAAAETRTGVFAASTLQELARSAGIDPVALEASVEAYNHSVDTGVDPEFGRECFPARIETAPFYAMQNHGITLISFAGLRVDSDLRVMTGSGVIPGLYAAGEVLGAGATCGRSFCGGMLLTPALSFGRWLGRRLAKPGGEGARLAGGEAR